MEQHKANINVALVIALVAIFILGICAHGLLTLVAIIAATAIGLSLLEINGQNVSHYNKYSKD